MTDETVEEPPLDPKTLAGWKDAVRLLISHLEELAALPIGQRIAMAGPISQMLKFFINERDRYQHKRMTVGSEDGTRTMMVMLRNVDSATRLMNAIKAFASPIVSDVRLGRDIGTKAREVSIDITPEPRA